MPNDGATTTQLGFKELLASTNDAASTARSVTAAMLGIAVTLSATILASSDEAILRNSLSAPFGIGAAINLSIAYALMPPVFLFLHVSALLQLYVLVRRLHLFEASLTSSIKTQLEDDRAKERDKIKRDEWRQLLTGFPFIQYFTDDEVEERNLDRALSKIRNLLLWIVVHATFAWIPIGLLLATLVSFLRFQSETITYVHLLSLSLDVVFVVWFQLAYTKLQANPIDTPKTLLFFSLFVFATTWFLELPLAVAFFAISGGILASLVHFALLALFPDQRAGGASFRNRCVNLYTQFFHYIVKRSALFWSALFLISSSFIAITSLLGFNWLDGVNIFALIASFLSLHILHIYQMTKASQYAGQHQNLNFGSRYQAFTPTQKIMWALRRSTIGFVVLALCWTQASPPSGAESACQVRWNWNDELKSELATYSSSEPKAGALHEPVPWPSNRLRLTWNIILAPAIGHGSLNCHATDNGGDMTLHRSNAPVERANLLDRWVCAYFGFGCRYLHLPSSALVNATASSAILIALANEYQHRDTAYDTGALRAIGLNLRARNLRFIRLEKSRLYGADLRQADLSGAEISETNLEGAIASEAKFDRARLNSATLFLVDLTGASFVQASMLSTDLIGSSLDSANFSQAELGHTKLQASWVEKAKFYGTKVTDVAFDSASLDSAVFLGAMIENSSFWGASLDGAIFQNSILMRVNFSGTSPEKAECGSSILIDNRAPTSLPKEALLPSLPAKKNSTGMPDRIVERFNKRAVHNPGKEIGLPCKEYKISTKQTGNELVTAFPTMSAWQDGLKKVCTDGVSLRHIIYGFTDYKWAADGDKERKQLLHYAAALLTSVAGSASNCTYGYYDFVGGHTGFSDAVSGLRRSLLDAYLPHIRMGPR